MREETSVTDVDLVAILGSMLDNAINGCMTVTGTRSMDISIRRQDIKLVLQCKTPVQKTSTLKTVCLSEWTEATLVSAVFLPPRVTAAILCSQRRAEYSSVWYC